MDKYQHKESRIMKKSSKHDTTKGIITDAREMEIYELQAKNSK